jgi:hypothetical protein
MKFMVLFAITVLFIGPVYAIENCMTGSWFNPAIDGEGINIEVTNEKVVGYYYSWYVERDLHTFQGDNDHPYEVSLYAYTAVLRSGALKNEWVGDVVIEAIDADTLRFMFLWKFDFHSTSSIPWCFTGCSGNIEYTRLTQPVACGR